MRSTTSLGRDASLIAPPMRDSRHLLIALWIVALLSGLTACDPGYGFTVHNPCDVPITVDLRDSDEFKRVGMSPRHNRSSLHQHVDADRSRHQRAFRSGGEEH